MKLGVGFATLLAAAAATLTYGVSIEQTPRALCLAGRSLHRLTGITDDTEPSWSPDGSQYVFDSLSLGGLGIANAGGTFVRPLVPPDRGDLIYNPAWSPTGDWIAYVTGYYGQNVALISPDGSRWQTVRGAGGGLESETASPTWAPDGLQLDYSYASSDPGAGPNGIYSIGIDGSDKHLVVPDGADPALSPDGTKLAYVKVTWHGAYGDTHDIFVSNADGSGEERLTFTATKDELDPAWSPDGTTLAFAVGSARIDEIDLRRGSERTVVQATNGYSLTGVSWRPPSATAAGRAQACVIAGTPGPDRLVGTTLADILVGGAGADTIEGGGGNDLLVGGPGHDRLFGGPGDDLFFAQDRTRDWIDGGSGHDTAFCDFYDMRRRLEDYCNY